MDEQLARLNVTYTGPEGVIQNGELPDPVVYDTLQEEIIQIAQEAIRNGDIPGITADPNADLEGFVADRFPVSGTLPCRIMVRPKTPFGQE